MKKEKTSLNEKKNESIPRGLQQAYSSSRVKTTIKPTPQEVYGGMQTLIGYFEKLSPDTSYLNNLSPTATH